MKTRIGSLMVLKFGLATSILFNLSSCKKGDTGPAGAQGPQGTAGNNGIANIISTTLSTSSWVWNSGNKTREVQFNGIASLSQNNISTGMIMVYEDFGSNIWSPLPLSYGIGANVTYHSEYYFTPNTLLVKRYYSDESDPGSWSGTYRLVVIPQGMVKPKVDRSNYGEVKKAYQLIE